MNEGTVSSTERAIIMYVQSQQQIFLQSIFTVSLLNINNIANTLNYLTMPNIIWSIKSFLLFLKYSPHPIGLLRFLNCLNLEIIPAQNPFSEACRSIFCSIVTRLVLLLIIDLLYIFSSFFLSFSSSTSQNNIAFFFFFFLGFKS